MQWFCEKIWETDFLNVDLEHMNGIILNANPIEITVLCMKHNQVT